MPSIVTDGRLEWGMQLPIQMLSLTLREPWEDEASVEDMVDVAVAAEAAGAFFVGVCDHIAIPDNDYARHMRPTWYDPIATLSYLAARTSRVRLLSVVYIIAYRHPLVSAKSFMTLDRLSGGRTIMGVGAGHVEAEFEALGLDFATRGARTDECIDAVRTSFATEYHGYTGEFFDYKDMAIGPRPVQPEIPIWIGGSSPPALRRVAERGDGWIPQGTARADMAAALAYIREHQQRIGRDAKLDLGWYPGWIYLGKALPEGLRDVPAAHLVGSAEQVADSLRYATELGTNILHIHFRSRDKHELIDQIEAFGRDVTPLLS